MNMKYRSMNITHLMMALVFGAIMGPISSQAISVDQMTVNGRNNPLGIGAENLSFGWTLKAEARGTVQSAYQIRVGTIEGGSNVWASGWVDSDQQVDLALPSSITLDSATRYYWQTQVKDGTGAESDWSAAAWFETGLLTEEDWSGAEWIIRTAGNGLSETLPLLRSEFVLGEGIASARLYASAQGLYEVSINGQKAGDQFLAPGWTDYGQRIQSQTYDITDLIHSGTNAIGAALADGWYRGHIGLGWSMVYGDQVAFVGKIKITYTDGHSEWFSTDTNWTASDGPFVQGDLQWGENYNANLNPSGWNTAGFNDSSWLAVGTVPNLSERLVPQPDEPIRKIDELTAISRTEILPGTWIYDLGQNMVGVPKVTLTGTAGQTITLRHGEEIYRTGSMMGQLYTENLRTAKATDSYTFAEDGTVTYQPTFTQHGFRYIEITGTDTPPALTEVHGVVLSSDLPDAGHLETSNTMLNQLVSNIRWGQRSNFLSIPTDTPARDERLGWTGDISVFAPAAARLKDTRAFLSKWMTDVRDVQWDNGNITAVVPRANGGFDSTGVGWSDAVITVPYSVWKATGDERILRENWSTMTDFYQFVYNSATGDGDLLEQGRSSWFSGDWLSLESGWNRLEEHKVIATAYFVEDTRMMAEMAAALNETAQAATWSARVPQIRDAFAAAYCNADGTMYQGTQCVYAMALGMNLISDATLREKIAGQFVKKLAADGNHLRTGFLGTPWLLPALSNIGRNDLAMKLLLNDDYPSWGFPISIGATTMWERWNSIQADLTFGPVDMNSFNHYAYGAVADWMFGNLGGIQALEAGYKTSRIAPLVNDSGLSRAACSQQTVYGQLSTEWTDSETGRVLRVVVPVNTTAEIILPASAHSIVYEGGAPVEKVSGVTYLRTEDGAKVYSVGSGSYLFSWAPEIKAAADQHGVVSFSIDWNSTLGAAQSSGNAGADIYAGVTNVAYWYNSWNGSRNNWAYTDMMDSEGNATTLAIGINGPWEGWNAGATPGAETLPDPDTWNRQMLAGYRNSTGSNPSTAVVTGLDSSSTYEAYLYFESDVGTRVGSISDGDDETCYFGFHPESVTRSETAFSWLPATASTTAGYSTEANYAKFTLSGTSDATFTLRAYDAGGTNPNGGGISGIQVVQIKQASPPSAPQNLIAKSGDGQVLLSWNAVADATSYRLKRSLTSGGPYEVVAGLTGTNIVNDVLDNGVPYYFVVSAVGVGGESPDSSEVGSVPSITVSSSEFVIANPCVDGGSNFSFTITHSVPGHNYGVLTTESLSPPAWSNLLVKAGNGSNLQLNTLIIDNETSRFFKLDVQRQ